jgi:hypothetical protein
MAEPEPHPALAAEQPNARLEFVRARHADRLAELSGDARARLERALTAIQSSADALAAFPLTNADEPATIFFARLRES